MNKKSILIITIVLLSLPATLFAVDNSCDLAQYDFLTNQAIIEPIFGFFTIATYPPLSQGFKFKVTDIDIEKWCKIKPELENIANQKNNERNADAFLILACGKWLFENKTNEAINMTKSVDTKYPNATTILSVKLSTQELCPLELNRNFYFYFYKLLRQKKLQEKSIFDRKSMSGTFIVHLIEYPMYASDIAKVLEYHLTGDINLLKKVLQNHPYSEMRKNKQYDKKAIQSKNGRFFFNLLYPDIHFERNEIIVAKYLSNADKQEGLTTFEKVVEAISDDGFYWWINERLGDKFNAQHDYSKAEKQYRLALKGYYNTISNETLYITMTHSKRARRNKKLNTSNWERKLLEIKKKINQTGGNVKVNTDELKNLQDIYQIKVVKPSPNEFSKQYIIKTFKEIHKKDKQFSESKNIRKEINEITDAFSNRVKKVNKDNKKDLLEQGKFIAICLTQLAGNESDTETRKIILAGIPKIINVEKPDKNIKLDESTKKKVDGYIAQITGIGKVDSPVPYPESHLSDLENSELLYAAEFVTTEKLTIETKRKMIRLLANNEDPVLFHFLSEIVLNNEDSQMKSSAAWGLERIIRKRAKDINENGKIILKK